MLPRVKSILLPVVPQKTKKSRSRRRRSGTDKKNNELSNLKDQFVLRTELNACSCGWTGVAADR